MLGWPKRCKLAHAFLWEYSYERLELAQLLGQVDAFLATVQVSCPAGSTFIQDSRAWHTNGLNQGETDRGFRGLT